MFTVFVAGGIVLIVIGLVTAWCLHRGVSIFDERPTCMVPNCRGRMKSYRTACGANGQMTEFLVCLKCRRIESVISPKLFV